MKTVPKPSKGRTVLFLRLGAEKDDSDPGVVTAVNPDDPRLVNLALFNGNVRRAVPYGFEQQGCWWWPPREEGTMEVED